MGGGTTVVEALAAGRRAVGIDINGLAHFVAWVKTTPLSERDARELQDWVKSDHLQRPVNCDSHDSALLDQPARNLPPEVRRFFGAVLQCVQTLRFPRQRRFARCALLRVGQWALDNRQHLPTAEEIQTKLQEGVEDMLGGLRDFVLASRSAGIDKNRITSSRALIQGSVADPATHLAIRHYGAVPSLVLTSPPYPGVHVLYHRWQVAGRRETPAPYWLADLRDGHGASYYTMGSRSPLGLRNYFTTLRQGFENLRSILSPGTTVVQLVAFSQTQEQLPLYMDILAATGYQEVQLPSLLASGNRIRTVPNRKWYTNTQASSDASHEVLLIHRVRD